VNGRHPFITCPALQLGLSVNEVGRDKVQTTAKMGTNEIVCRRRRWG